jgi:hypothetical protein
VQGPPGLNLRDNRSRNIASGTVAGRRLLARLDVPDKQAAKPGDAQANRAERPGVMEHRVGRRRRRRPDDRHHDRDAERGSDLARDRVHPGRRREALARRGGDRGAAEVGEQRARADSEHHHAREPLAGEVGRHPDSSDEPQHRPTPEQAPGDENGARADAPGQPARRGGHHHRDDRADTEGQASLQDRVSPYAREEQDVH